jgi:hypothetical protein
MANPNHRNFAGLSDPWVCEAGGGWGKIPGKWGPLDIDGRDARRDSAPKGRHGIVSDPSGHPTGEGTDLARGEASECSR